VASLFPSPTSSYRGRLAPSPTGYLHVGHARTFFAAFQRARAAGGALILRMEDLDPERSRNEYAEAALDDLRWLGIRWHEGPDKGGPFAPYEQSRRASSYLNAWKRLRDGGFIYPCRCSRKDLAAALSAPHEGAAPQATPADPDPLDDESVYPGTCRPVGIISGDAPERPNGMNWRFRVQDGKVIEFTDQSLGLQRFVAGVDFGDFLVWRRDGLPSYQLACVADDAAMGITEVVRGADLLKSTARQILLNRALGFPNPDWYHCRLVVDHNGHRLAKRHDALSLKSLRHRGLTPMKILSADLPEEA
jgi:glutamyl/glutaminyl-tRNA synthetase